MNIGNRVAFVKKINRENTTINNRLNSIRSVVPEAEKLVSDDQAKFENYRKFASRYKGEQPDEYLAKLQANKV